MSTLRRRILVIASDQGLRAFIQRTLRDGGFAVEAVGVATGVPFGSYTYGTALGPALAGVPLVIPLAWTWMAWPAWIAAAQLTRRRAARVLVAAIGLAAWDLFLDPQMVAEGYWTWAAPAPALPWVPDVPVGNYVAWFAVAVLMMAALSPIAGGPAVELSAGPGRNLELPLRQSLVILAVAASSTVKSGSSLVIQQTAYSA